MFDVIFNACGPTLYLAWQCYWCYPEITSSTTDMELPEMRKRARFDPQISKTYTLLKPFLILLHVFN